MPCARRYYACMNARFLLAGALLGIFFVSGATPLLTQAATADQLRAEIAAILAEVEFLRSQLERSGPATSVPQATQATQPAALQTIPTTSGLATFQYSRCPDLQFNLERGDTDGAVAEEVSMLQRFLAQDIRLYPEGEVTGYFGALTEAAVQRFQVRHGIVTAGDYRSTGYGRVGPRTRWAIRNSCGVVTSQTTPTQTPTTTTPPSTTQSTGSSVLYVPPTSGGTGVVGGSSNCFVQPDRGVAPLSVRARVLFGGSLCDGNLTYQIDWGDGDITPPRVCSDTNPHYDQLTHTYLAPAVYTARLIQSHPNAQFEEQSCAVSVSSNVAPSSGNTIAGNCKNWTDGCNICSRDYLNGPARCTMRYCTAYGTAQCYSYFSAESTSGATGDTLTARVLSDASRTVEFSALINASRSCDGGVWRIYFGDGDSSLEALGAGPCQSSLRTVRHSYDNAGTYSAFLVKDTVEVDRITIVVGSSSSRNTDYLAQVLSAVETIMYSLFR